MGFNSSYRTTVLRALGGWEVMTSDPGKTRPEPVGKQPRLLEELKKGVGWVLYQVVGRYIYLILGLMMLVREKYPDTIWADLVQITLYGFAGFLLLFGLWLATAMVGLMMWGYRRAAGEEELRARGY